MPFNRISQVADALDGERPVEELEAQKCALGDVPGYFETGRFGPGDRVRVVCGVFAGVGGAVAERSAAGRLVIVLKLLQCGVCQEIAECCLVRAE